MAGYIGVQPVPQATQNRSSFTATANQTTFATEGYTVGFVDVYKNGLKLASGSDFTATNGSDVVLTSGASANDVIEVISFVPFEVSDVSSISTGVFSIRNSGSQSELRLFCESNNAHYASLQAPAHSEFSGNITLTLPATTGTLISTANSNAPTTTTSSSDADFVLVDDGGVMKKITPANLGIGGGSGSITVQDEGSALSTEATTLNFVGTGVTASGTGSTKTITISGGSGSGGGTTAQTWGASLAGKLQIYNSSSNDQNVLISSPNANIVLLSLFLIILDLEEQ